MRAEVFEEKPVICQDRFYFVLRYRFYFATKKLTKLDNFCRL